uniref:Zinc finger, CCHC-type, retrotransposon Gag domain protein n=1 Tax=Tanacetum cinerariifolium TaxID=118510 RepID=A0A6L2MD49_TANCI|nr:zinc finger, CCHC-type, retrotransposon Gag domain protein [Tanacetum cinerariifolium]
MTFRRRRKVYKKGEEWLGLFSWKEFKDLFNAEYALSEEIDKIREKFQTLMQTNESVNELWKKFKVERFQKMLRDEIQDVVSPFKYTTLTDLLSTARMREADLQRMKSKEVKESKRKLEHGDQDPKKPKHDHA